MNISLIVPVYNEQDTLERFYRAVRREPSLQGMTVEILFINDGSTDGTEAICADLAMRDEWVTVINFSRNFGKESALFAGLEYAEGDAMVPIDVDLQDPIELVAQMVERWQQGADVVLAKRRDRAADTPFKRWSARLYYRLHNRIASTHIEENVGDFRLLDRKVVAAIRQLPEQQLFMKGVLSWVGFRTEIIEYDRPPRVAGNSKFSVWRLWNLALDGITSFSTVPLRLWTYVGGGVSLFAFAFAVYMVVDKLLWGTDVPGYPSLMTAILFLGGVQLIGIGILGEYIGRIYQETKHRPRYVVRKVVGRRRKIR
ncbi:MULTISPECIES: glycosyltransferase family 2 protein [Pseudomonas]|uniref:Glycosyltransferase n=2 Tax=Pseudomonas TaxID=286 RepID=A0AAX0VY01_9PSED|nr:MULTISPECIES: glycosyltransferase family 2 protein [Pseudomonas]MCO7621867.1 glycosyltransferase family 2 protein [Pseudomonas guariconensis]MDM9595793.1 glycosyltransferase family 2 protein [Pseudomonas guariconensis]MDM9608623.1 glycosyltransferase family 2 protein [Pseudomonas guariconensis]MDM9613580.1 glycosyltransferase family 2 protein [Pseudomonas guariconensis]MEB3840951.1 glycosyltransferase family 2 protein [Pseudomonas guariconensis]